MRINFENIFENGKEIIIGTHGLHHTHWVPQLFSYFNLDCPEQQIVMDHITGIQSRGNNWLDDIDMRLYINGLKNERFCLKEYLYSICGGYDKEDFTARITIDLSPSSSRWVEISYFNPEDEEELYGSIVLKGGEVSIYIGNEIMECELSSIAQWILTDNSFTGLPRFIEIK